MIWSGPSRSIWRWDFRCRTADRSSRSSFEFGGTYLNLILDTRGPVLWWGRVIVHVSDVDAVYQKALAAGYRPEAPPADASWGERYFHVCDPDGHEISIAKRL
jgi:catechol 2,3-dioxygenase-like lactoylglutathione lyase family enzyme